MEAPHLGHQVEKKSGEGTLFFHGKIKFKNKVGHPVFENF